MVKRSVGVLKPSVAMKDWMCVRILLYRLTECVIDKFFIVFITYHLGDNSSVIEVEVGAEINFVNGAVFNPFEFGYIGKPDLVRFFGTKVSV